MDKCASKRQGNVPTDWAPSVTLRLVSAPYSALTLTITIAVHELPGCKGL